jgi:glycerol-3-phosphate acyltransferase PlsY
MKILLLILIAYLLGSIQTGLWIGKVFFHTNLREHGSGNTGTTNTFRVLGKTAGTITFLVDMLKGTLAVLLPIWLGVTEVSPLIIGFFAIIGHVFPFFTDLRVEKPLRQVLGCFLVLFPSTLSSYSWSLL